MSLSFHHVVPGLGTQVPGLGGKHLNPLSHLMGLRPPLSVQRTQLRIYEVLLDLRE